MLTYEDVKTFLKAGLTAKGYGGKPPLGPNQITMPRFDVGPVSLPQLQKLAPGAMVFATVGNGAGHILEQTYDQVFITVRVLGPQHNYDAAERLAYDVDKLFLAINSNGVIGSTKVLYVTRTGGAPQLIDYDATERYHFQTTYITPAETGL